MFTITKQFSFEASHQLRGMPEGHQCGRLHGHSYRVEVILGAEELEGPGFVTDYGELASFGEYVRSRCDHRHLNEQFAFNPTAENLARHFYEWINGTQEWPLRAVRVSETGKTWAEYRRDSPPVNIIWEGHPCQTITLRGGNTNIVFDPILP